MNRLCCIVCEELIYVFKRAPDSFSDGKEYWNLLRRAKEVVEALAGEGQVDSGSDGRTVTEYLVVVRQSNAMRSSELFSLTFKINSVGSAWSDILSRHGKRWIG